MKKPPANASKKNAQLLNARKRMQLGQVELRAAIREVKALGGKPFRTAPVLGMIHLQNCKVVPNRLNIIDALAQTLVPANGVIAEIGSQTGRFAKELLPRLKPSKFHIVDITFKLFDRPAFESDIASKRVELHEQPSGDFLQGAPDKSFDLIYIDAGHGYANVKQDALLSAKKVKDGGIIMFNDYILWSHTGAVPYGVVQAVNELCIEDGWEIIYFSLDSNMFCDVAIKRLKKD